MEYDEITRQVYNGRNASYPDLSRKISTLMSFFENCFQSHRKWFPLVQLPQFLADLRNFELQSPDPHEVASCAEMRDVGGVVEIVQKYGRSTGAASPEFGAFFALAS